MSKEEVERKEKEDEEMRAKQHYRNFRRACAALQTRLVLAVKCEMEGQKEALRELYDKCAPLYCTFRS